MTRRRTAPFDTNSTPRPSCAWSCPCSTRGRMWGRWSSACAPHWTASAGSSSSSMTAPPTARERRWRASGGLSAIGFKILLDLLASLPEKPRVLELAYVFRSRVAGESKLDAAVLFDFGLLLLDKLIGGIVPVRFVMFAMIGALGVVAHLLVLRLGLTFGLGFDLAQSIATGCAIVGNFALNNEITFRDRKLKGRRVLPGLVVFAAVCAVGAVANLNVASLMVSAGHQSWWAAGVVGAAMSLVWNYAVGSTLTWRR